MIGDRYTAQSMGKLRDAFNPLGRRLHREQRIYGLATPALLAFAAAPFAAILALALLIRYAPTREAALWTLQENSIIELATFAALAVAGVYGLFSPGARGPAAPAADKWFRAAFSLALLAIAMEEVAWGQWFFGFETPEFVARVNRQNELTLHNLPGLQGKTEVLRLAYGLGGLVGCALAAVARFRAIAPPLLLAPWFLAIAGHAGVDLALDFRGGFTWTDWYFNRTAEAVELLIGVSAGLYLYWTSGRYRTAAAPAAG